MRQARWEGVSAPIRTALTQSMSPPLPGAADHAQKGRRTEARAQAKMHISHAGPGRHSRTDRSGRRSEQAVLCERGYVGNCSQLVVNALQLGSRPGPVTVSPIYRSRPSSRHSQPGTNRLVPLPPYWPSPAHARSTGPGRRDSGLTQAAGRRNIQRRPISFSPSALAASDPPTQHARSITRPQTAPPPPASSSG